MNKINYICNIIILNAILMPFYSFYYKHYFTGSIIISIGVLALITKLILKIKKENCKLYTK